MGVAAYKILGVHNLHRLCPPKLRCITHTHTHTTPHTHTLYIYIYTGNMGSAVKYEETNPLINSSPKKFKPGLRSMLIHSHAVLMIVSHSLTIQQKDGWMVKGLFVQFPTNSLVNVVTINRMTKTTHMHHN